MTYPLDVLTAIESCPMQGNLVFMRDLDQSMFRTVHHIFVEAGGCWNRRHKSVAFRSSAREVIEPILLTGRISPPQDFAGFRCPPGLAQRLVALAQVQQGHLLLDPSAGAGTLALAAQARGATVHCIEICADKANQLRAFGFEEVFEGDFLTMHARPLYDRVLTLPPFEGEADVRHVLHAHAFLKPGGVLAAVIAASVTFRSTRLAWRLRSLVDECGGAIEPLPDGTFRASGNDAAAVIVTVPALDG